MKMINGIWVLPAQTRWVLCLFFKGGIKRWGTELLLLWQSLMTKPGPQDPSILRNNNTTPRSYLKGNTTLQMHKESALEPPSALRSVSASEQSQESCSLHSVSVRWSSLGPSFLRAMWVQETRGWVDKSLFQGGTRNLNLSQASDLLPFLPLLSEFLWNATPPVQTKQFHISNEWICTGHGTSGVAVTVLRKALMALPWKQSPSLHLCR